MADKITTDGLGRQYTYQNGQRVFVQVSAPVADDIAIVSGHWNRTKSTIDIGGIRYSLTKVGPIS